MPSPERGKSRSEALRVRIERLRDSTATRDEFVQALVPLYRGDMVLVARICDEEIDRRGRLLGYVRAASRAAS